MIPLCLSSRCSAAFFAEERAALHKKREKIRLLQQRKDAGDLDLKDLPEDIPLPLSIGTKVTGRDHRIFLIPCPRFIPHFSSRLIGLSGSEGPA